MWEIHRHEIYIIITNGRALFLHITVVKLSPASPKPLVEIELNIYVLIIPGEV